MNIITIEGGYTLSGEVTVSGSKNAALPIIFACILTNGISRIENLPDIGDVRCALEIISSLGAAVERKDGVTYVDTRNLSYSPPDPTLVSKIRASTYLIGSCLSAFGVCPIMPFGGCDFSARPIDMHISACLSLGGYMDGECIRAERLSGSEITFRQPSVGATVNAILLSASAEGDSVIRGCAVEPHIDSLIEFIRSCGGEILRQGNTVYVSGRRLHGGSISVIGDMIEAGSYLATGLMCGGEVTVCRCPTGDMTAVLDSLRALGSEIIIDSQRVKALPPKKARPLSVCADPHPAFPTDLQPIFAPLMAKYRGGEICDRVWQSRFGYLRALSAFGIRWELAGNRAFIKKSEIVKGSARAPDLRGGMACLMCALSAEGESEIYSSNLILRGYEDLEKKLCSLGARININ